MRRSARRTGRGAGRRAVRRIGRRRRRRQGSPEMIRQAVIKRPLGALLIVGAATGVAYKLGKNEVEQIQAYTGLPPQELSEAGLQVAMNNLGIEPHPLNEADRAAVAELQETLAPSPDDPVIS